MTQKIAIAAIIIGILGGYSAIHLSHKAAHEACVSAWISDMQAAQSEAQKPNHDLPFLTNEQLREKFPSRAIACAEPDQGEDFVNGTISALIIGVIVYFALLIVRKVTKVLS